MPPRKKKGEDIELPQYSSKWKPGEPVAVLLNGEKIVGYEIFDPYKCHSTTGKRGYAELKPKKEPKYGQVLVIRKGQSGRTVVYDECDVFKLADVPKKERKTFDEVFGKPPSIAVKLKDVVNQSEVEDLNMGLGVIVESEE